MSPLRLPIPWGIPTHTEYTVSWAHPRPNPNGISVGSAVLAQVIVMSNRQTDRQDTHTPTDTDRKHGISVTIGHILSPQYWPSNSPDLNPVDYAVWGIVQERVQL